MIYKAPNHRSGWILSSLFYKWGQLSLVEVKYFPKGTQWACGRPRIWNSYLSDPKSHSFSPISRTLYLVEFPQDTIPRVALSNQRVWLSLWALLLTHQWKYQWQRDKENYVQTYCLSFPKISCSFRSEGRTVRLHFFLYLRKLYAGKFSYYFIFHAADFLWAYEKYWKRCCSKFSTL